MVTTEPCYDPASMITFPAVYLLGLFAAIFSMMVVVMLAHLYHGYRFGRHDPLTMGINTAFLVLAVAITLSTAILLAPVDWSTRFTITTPTVSGPSSLQVPGTRQEIPNVLPSEQ